MMKPVVLGSAATQESRVLGVVVVAVLEVLDSVFEDMISLFLMLLNSGLLLEHLSSRLNQIFSSIHIQY